MTTLSVIRPKTKLVNTVVSVSLVFSEKTMSPAASAAMKFLASR